MTTKKKNEKHYMIIWDNGDSLVQHSFSEMQEYVKEVYLSDGQFCGRILEVDVVKEFVAEQTITFKEV